MIDIPQIETDRLLLRAPCADDFSVYRGFYADADASSSYGGPLDPGMAWRRLAADLGHWELRGFGMWSVVERASGDMVGGCGLVWPESWPRHELTWWIVSAARRSGFAFEASRAIVGFAYRQWKWPQVETHMDDDNDAARRLAEKLGGTVIAREPFPDGQERNIYRLPDLPKAE
ncbi:MAG: GNAT family N-acetyltransferase [Pseudomonadota bacterium]